MNRLMSLVMGGAALMIEILSVFFALNDPTLWTMLLAFVLHAVAAFVAATSARAIGARGAREYDTVLMVALLVPLFGPGIAWMMPVASDDEAKASKEMLEQVDSRMKHAEDYERPFFLGDFEADLARQVNSVSYYEVLEKGDLEQKRDALRKLARLGEPRHMALVARALEDPETELRLCAYLELDRIRQRHEKVLAGLQDQTRGHDAWTKWLDDIIAAPVDEEGVPDLSAFPPPTSDRSVLDSDIDRLRASLANAHLDYAISGTLDETMRDFRLDRCLEECEQALAQNPHNARALVVMARAYCERGILDQSEACLLRLPGDVLLHPAIRALRARIRFDGRDFEGAKELGYGMLREGHEAPHWLRALCYEELVCAPDGNSTVLAGVGEEGEHALVS